MTLDDLLQLTLNESYSVMRKAFKDQGANVTEIDKYIKTYKNLVDTNRLPSKHTKDTNQLAKFTWNDFKQHVNDWEHVPSKSDLKKRDKPEGNETIILDETDDWLVVIPLSHKSSCFHGKHTDWCTTKPMESYYSEYVLDKNITLIYLLSKGDGGMYAIAYHNDTEEIEMFDRSDDSLHGESFKKETGYDAINLVNKAQRHDDAIDTGKDASRETDPVYLAQQAIDNGARDFGAEKYIVKHPYAGRYARYFFKKGWPQAEQAISTNADAAYTYATMLYRFQHNFDGISDTIVRGISKKPEFAFYYANRIRGSKWAKGTPIPDSIIKAISRSDEYSGKFSAPGMEDGGVNKPPYKIPDLILGNVLSTTEGTMNFIRHDIGNAMERGRPDVFDKVLKDPNNLKRLVVICISQGADYPAPVKKAYIEFVKKTFVNVDATQVRRFIRDNIVSHEDMTKHEFNTLVAWKIKARHAYNSVFGESL